MAMHVREHCSGNRPGGIGPLRIAMAAAADDKTQ
jgi:hypothetical protein